jgi:hypothetical protein
MSYTISTLTFAHGNPQELEFGKSGNKWWLALYNKDTKELTHKEYIDEDMAIATFNFMATIMLRGEYSEKDRRMFLLRAE